MVLAFKKGLRQVAGKNKFRIPDPLPSTPPPMTGRCIKFINCQLIDKIINRNPNDSEEIMAIKSLDLIAATAISGIVTSIIALVEIPIQGIFWLSRKFLRRVNN